MCVIFTPCFAICTCKMVAICLRFDIIDVFETMKDNVCISCQSRGVC